MNKLYHIVSGELLNEGSLKAVVKLNPAHQIFEGHFPGNPILPGICTVQMAKEILEKTISRDLTLMKSGNIKYLGFVNPLQTPEMCFNITFREDENKHIASAINVTAGENLVCSFKAEYANIPQ